MGLLVWFTIAGIWIIDRISKILVQQNFDLNESLIVIPKFFHLTYVLNPGAAFGLFAGKTWIFILTAILVMVGIIFAQFKLPREEWVTRLSLGMIGGGALGNLYDRIVIGKVVDYFDFQIWAFVFNFADSAIVVGVGLLLLMTFIDDRKDRSSQ
jgi:signal peptidase II